jgi:hypothetical protein
MDLLCVEHQEVKSGVERRGRWSCLALTPSFQGLLIRGGSKHRKTCRGGEKAVSRRILMPLAVGTRLRGAHLGNLAYYEPHVAMLRPHPPLKPTQPPDDAPEHTNYSRLGGIWVGKGYRFFKSQGTRGAVRSLRSLAEVEVRYELCSPEQTSGY